MSEKKSSDQKNGDPIVIKKYANRRLYNTATSKYVTLDHLAQMVKEKLDFAVFDAKSGENITRSVLTQIIVEEESKGENLLPIGFLRQIIGFYGDQVGGLLPQYLEHTMQTFSANQEQYRKAMEDTFGSFFPMQQLEDMGKQNMSFFENAMKMFAAGAANQEQPQKPARKTEPAPKAEKSDSDLNDLKQQLSDMQSKIDALANNSGN